MSSAKPLSLASDTPPPSFQDIIQRLSAYWAEQGCALLQPYDMEVGAGHQPYRHLPALFGT